jgi:hypothetical protein
MDFHDFVQIFHRNEGHIVIHPIKKTGSLAVFDRKDCVEGLEKILSEKT